MKQQAIYEMLEATRKKQINCIQLWLKNTKLKNKQYEE